MMLWKSGILKVNVFETQLLWSAQNIVQIWDSAVVFDFRIQYTLIDDTTTLGMDNALYDPRVDPGWSMREYSACANFGYD